MIVVHDLNERLDLGSPLDFLLAHSSGYSEWVSFDTCDQSVSEFLVLQKKINGQKFLNTFFPSSYCFTMIAFFPACLPARRMTTLPAFILYKKSYTHVDKESHHSPIATHCNGFQGGGVARGAKKAVWSRKERMLTFYPLLLLIYNPNK